MTQGVAENRIKIGVAGVARHGATILRAIQTSDRFTVDACFDTDPEALAGAARAHAAFAAGTFAELVSRKGLEAVVLVTPNHRHREQALAALGRGLHVFVEKPLAPNVAECREILASASRAGRVVQVGHNTRKRTVFRRAHELLSGGAIGRLVACHAHISFDFGRHAGVPEWKKDPASCPLLPMTQLGIHFIDTLQYFAGPIRRVSCFARAAEMQSASGGEVIDSVAALLQFEEGAVGTIQSHYVTAPTYEIVLHGTMGKMTCFEDRVELETKAREGYADSVLSCLEADGTSFVEELTEFAECIRTGKRPETGAETGMRNVALIEAMLMSQREGRAVDLAELLPIQY